MSHRARSDGYWWKSPSRAALTPMIARALVLLTHGPLERRDVGKAIDPRKWFSTADATAPHVSDPVIDGLVKRNLVRVMRGVAKITDEGKRVAAGLVRMCRRCGCTEARACERGCTWAQSDLCSACVVTTDDLEERAA